MNEKCERHGTLIEHRPNANLSFCFECVSERALNRIGWVSLPRVGLEQLIDNYQLIHSKEEADNYRKEYLKKD